MDTAMIVTQPVLQKKICMLGGFSVGKTSLVKRFVESVFSETYLTTVGVKIDKKTVDLGERAVNPVLWDVAGEDDVSTLRMTYLLGLRGICAGRRRHAPVYARGGAVAARARQSGSWLSAIRDAAEQERSAGAVGD